MTLRTKPIGDSITAQVHFKNITMVEYQPGNGTRYTLQIVDYTGINTPTPTVNLNPLVARAMDDMGFGGNYTVASMCDGKGTVMTVRPGGFLAASYVQEKLRVCEADARVLAEIIATYTHSRADNAQEK
jgi:hypothetical protein